MLMLEKLSYGKQKYVKDRMFNSARMKTYFVVTALDDTGRFKVEFFDQTEGIDISDYGTDIDHIYSIHPRYFVYDEIKLTKSTLILSLYKGEIDNFNYEFSIDYFLNTRASFDLSTGKYPNRYNMVDLAEECIAVRSREFTRYTDGTINKRLKTMISKVNGDFSKVRYSAAEFNKLIDSVEGDASASVMMKIISATRSLRDKNND